MSSEIPPTYYFSGITYNPDFYQSSSSDYLTASTGKSYFLSYPIAQGTETISTLNTSSIETPTPTIAFSLLSTQTANLNIGNTTTGTSGQTIKVGPSTLTSVHCGNIDHKGTTINNASAPALGDISICDAQTSGVLNIGTGVRLTTGNGGGINIGTGSNTATVNSITLGSNSSAVKINGSLTIGTNAPTAPASISSTGAISGTTISGSGVITGLSFQNTANSASISSTGTIGGNALTLSSTGYITSGGLAAIPNGIHVVGEIRSTTGDLKLTTGKLIAGTLDAVADTTAGTTALKIGSNVQIGDIEIGNAQTTGDIKIGLSDTSGATITVGTSATATTINGNLSLTNPITLPTTAVTPTSSQLGYYTTAGVGYTTVSYFAAFPSGTALGSISSLPIGRYIFLLAYAADTFTNVGTYFEFYANMTNGSCDAMLTLPFGQSGSTGGKKTGSSNGLVIITATSGTISLVGRTQTTGTNVNVYVNMRLIRIA